MERNLKFKVGDEVKVIATEEQLKTIGILLEFCNNDFYYIVEIDDSTIHLPYRLSSNNYYLPEEYLDYAD